MAKEWNGVQSVLKELIMAEDEAFIAGTFLVKYYTYMYMKGFPIYVGRGT